MTPLRLLIVDDERLARQELRRLLAAHAEVEIVGEASHGEQVLPLQRELRPDALLLDVQMPGMDGLAVARALGVEARIIFCTAHADFAVEAFDLNAFDYLVKPVEPARLGEALERLRRALPHSLLLPDDHRVLLRRGERMALVRLGDITLIESRDNYLSLQTPDGEYLLAGSLARLLPRLDPQRWLQLSRQAIVRLDAIVGLQAPDGSLVVELSDGRRVSVSRRQSQMLRHRFSLL
ncbi:LytR/AlgR family response regulator transcription factor [Paucibacter sp. JuS9]|uniref:LytR/AlgR family response regulator transcription factor n=1 Tax=Paucibacter sp. JuS9 TaxID=3228748 RepID=UPI003756D1EB